MSHTGGRSTPAGEVAQGGSVCVMLSESADMKEQAVLAGATFFITKPFTAEAFAEMLGAVAA